MAPCQTRAQRRRSLLSRKISIPALDLFEEIVGRKVALVIFEDNQATEKVGILDRSTKVWDMLRDARGAAYDAHR